MEDAHWKRIEMLLFVVLAHFCCS